MMKVNEVLSASKLTIYVAIFSSLFGQLLMLYIGVVKVYTAFRVYILKEDISDMPELPYSVKVDPNKKEGYDEATKTFYVKSEDSPHYGKFKEYNFLRNIQESNRQAVINAGYTVDKSLSTTPPEGTPNLLSDPMYIPEGKEDYLGRKLKAVKFERDKMISNEEGLEELSYMVCL